MKKEALLFLLLGTLLFGESLTQLLTSAEKNNQLIRAQQLLLRAKDKSLDSAHKAYYPTLDTALFYSRDDAPTPFDAGTTYGARASISYNLYEGGKRTYDVATKKSQKLAQSAQLQMNKEDTALFIVKRYFSIRSMLALLKAREDASKAVHTQLQRVERFYEAQLATSDDVARLQAAYEKNRYEIESLSFDIFSAKKELELLSGMHVDDLAATHFQKHTDQKAKELPVIAKLRHSADALLYTAKGVASYYRPTIALKESFSLYGYANKPKSIIPIDFLDNQNSIRATLSLRLFDFGRLREQQEAIKLQADALREQMEYKNKELSIKLELAYRRIETTQRSIQSAKSGLRAAQSALATITKKFKAGIVDNVVYLDALSTHTAAKARYEKSLNDLEIAYATLYYYQGKNLKELLQ